jgi:hypothetical protein
MTIQKRNKLNQMFRQWPTSGLCTTSALREQGISTALLYHYTRRGWLISAGRGVYQRPGGKTEWQVIVNTLQREGYPVHVGGLSALELHGYGHHLHMQERTLFLYGPARTHLPAWFTSAINRAVFYAATNLFQTAPGDTLQTVTLNGPSVPVSSPERAALEMLHFVPGKVGFNEAFEIIGGLGLLRPAIMQGLLECCASIKTKRLFLYCAREAGFNWYADLNRDRINLGTGKREVVSNGVLDKEFLVTVQRQPFPAEIPF